MYFVICNILLVSIFYRAFFFLHFKRLGEMGLFIYQGATADKIKWLWNLHYHVLYDNVHILHGLLLHAHFCHRVWCSATYFAATFRAYQYCIFVNFHIHFFAFLARISKRRQTDCHPVLGWTLNCCRSDDHLKLTSQRQRNNLQVSIHFLFLWWSLS